MHLEGASYRFGKDRQFSLSVLVEVFDISSQTKPDFHSQLTRKFSFSASALRVLKNTPRTSVRGVGQNNMRAYVCISVYLEEDSLQLSTVFSTILLREDDCVCRDAVIGHPAVPLQHPYHNVWKAVLRLDGRYRPPISHCITCI